MKGCFHVHAGSLWDTIFTPVEGFPITSLDFKNRVSVGFGLFTEMPMLGKIGIIFSRAVIKESGDQPQSIEVVFGRDF
jgi:outer membrane protein assembly factor BamA